jgi:SAM-dependent methyltransferase
MLNRLKDILAGHSRAPDPSERPATGSEPDSGQLDPFEVGLWDDMSSGWYRNEQDEIFQGFPVAPKDVVLDVGCGDGGRSLFCATRGCHVIYSDIDPEKVVLTAERLRGSAAREQQGIVSDTDPLPLEPETVSRVIATEIIEHVEDPGRFLGELVRVGTPGALYLLTVPGDLGEKAQVGLAAPQYFQKPNHIQVISRPEFEALIGDAGLEVVSYSEHGFFWTLWWMFFWSSAQPQVGPPWTDLLDSWARTWVALRETPQGPMVKDALDAILPKFQVVVARKPDI